MRGKKNASNHVVHLGQAKINKYWYRFNSQPAFFLSSRVRWLIMGVLVALIVSLTMYERVRANGGALDSSFGGGSGTVITDFGTDGEAYAMAIQADSKIVVAGRSRPDSNSYHNTIALARYNMDGTLDPTFGNSGKAIDTAQPSQAFAVAVQSDGKILTSGFGAANVTRFNSDGSLDTTFGAGGQTGFLVNPYAMILQPDGKILVGGYFIVKYQTTNFAVARYNSDGTVDTSFGTGGKVTTQFYGGHDEIHALALQSDGKIVAVGQASWGGNDYYAVLARYDSNGNLDTSFGNNGKVTTDFSPNDGMKYHRLYAVAVQPDGKIVAGGATRHYGDWDSFAIARYNNDGSPDLTFGNAGQVTMKVLGLNASASGLALQPDGKFFAGGCATTSYDCSSGASFALVHYNSNGSLDTTFGSNGTVVTQIGGYGESASAIALQSDGKVVLAGSSKYASANCCNYNFALARYLADSASPPPTPMPTPTPTPTPCGTNVAAASDGASINASSEYAPEYGAGGIINGDRKGLNWGAGGGWNDATVGAFPDNVVINLQVNQPISEIDVYSLQDNYTNPVEPTDTMTFNNYGLTDFQVQIPDGSGGWVDVPGGHVTGNNLVKRRIILASPVTTDQIRVLVNSSADGVYSRIVEVEAFSCNAQVVPTPTPSPTPDACTTNVAAASYGASASASSEAGAGYAASGAIDGNHIGNGWGGGVGWNDATAAAYPDNLDINLGVTQQISEIDVYSLQDNYTSPVEPTNTMTFTQYGLVDFQVQIPDGQGGWVDVAGGHITNNNLVKRRIIFAAAVTTNRIRILVNSSADGVYSRIVEVEAFSCNPQTVATLQSMQSSVASKDYLLFREEQPQMMLSRTSLPMQALLVSLDQRWLR